jgi:hypothetical protein
VTSDTDTTTAASPRLGAVSFLHHLGSAINHHVHLHACATDGVVELSPFEFLDRLADLVPPPPLSPARGPPTEWADLVQAHDDCNVFQASPDELPVIDIHSP